MCAFTADSPIPAIENGFWHNLQYASFCCSTDFFLLQPTDIWRVFTQPPQVEDTLGMISHFVGSNKYQNVWWQERAHLPGTQPKKEWGLFPLTPISPLPPVKKC